MVKLKHYQNLYATREGRIYRKVNGRFVERATYEDDHGRLRLGVTDPRTPKRYRKRFVAWLILEAFVGPRPKGLECCHLDDNPKNNHLSNLRWDTHKNNMVDCVDNGNSLRGRKNPNVKLNKEQVLEIRKSKGNQYEIAKRFNISQGRVSRIKNRISWYWL